MAALQIQVNLEKPERKTEAVPPEVHSGNVCEYRINVVNVTLNHEYGNRISEPDGVGIRSLKVLARLAVNK